MKQKKTKLPPNVEGYLRKIYDTDEPELSPLTSTVLNVCFCIVAVIAVAAIGFAFYVIIFR
jgi:type II secretory pathway component PulF